MAQRIRTDWTLMVVILSLVAFGLLMVYSASAVIAAESPRTGGNLFFYVVRQALWIALAVPVMLWIKGSDYRRLNSPSWAFPVLGVVIVLLVVVYVLDSRHRWLPLPGARFQPSELAKPAVIIFLAYFLTLRREAINNRHTLIPAAVAVGAVIGGVLVADVGIAVVLAVTAAVMFLIAGLDLRYVATAFLCFVLATAVAIYFMPYRLVRIISFLGLSQEQIEWIDRWIPIKEYMKGAASALDPTFQSTQGLIGVGSGGPLGMGLMNGIQKLFYIPEIHNDFIFAAVGEEFGFVGAALVVCAFLVILWRGLRIAFLSESDFGRYLALGVTTMVVVQAFINISVVLAVLPTKGITLPMISYGGSSLLSTMICMGLLLSVSDYSA